ncbi:MAG: hypothetical protein FJZ01_25875 [Candidatus Sericytochromatia bacterium]|nr:hypothetical protein [Candidatus Tanganyikabacteria bacterium]
MSKFAILVALSAALLAGCPPGGGGSSLANLLAGERGADPGPARTISGSWKAYRMDYTTNPPSSVTSTIWLLEDGTFEMKSGSSYQGGGLTRMSSAGAGAGKYELRGDALKLLFSDGSELTGSVQGENLSIGGKSYYPCSGFAC